MNIERDMKYITEKPELMARFTTLEDRVASIRKVLPWMLVFNGVIALLVFFIMV